MSAPIPPLFTRCLLAIRPKTLPLTLAPVSAGIALAYADTGQFAAVIALCTVLAALAIQIGTNLYNDAADFERGTDTPQRTGPQRVTAQGWFRASQVKIAAHVLFLCAFLLGIALLLRGGWPIFSLGSAALLAGYAYTAGPRPIAYGPLGELFVLVFFGIAAVAGSHYLQTLTLSWSAISVGIALGLPAAAVLTVNNYRDLDTDRAAGRRTLCHYLDRPRSRFLYAALLLTPVPMLWATELPGTAWSLVAALPLALGLIVQLGKRSGAALNTQLAQTAFFQLVLTALLILGFLL